MCVALLNSHRVFKIHMRAHVQSTRHLVFLLIDSFMTRHRSGLPHLAMELPLLMSNSSTEPRGYIYQRIHLLGGKRERPTESIGGICPRQGDIARVWCIGIRGGEYYLSTGLNLNLSIAILWYHILLLSNHVQSASEWSIWSDRSRSCLCAEVRRSTRSIDYTKFIH